jgi:hypothetical protein
LGCNRHKQETTKGNSLCSYLYLKLSQISCFPFYIFSSTKLENKRVEEGVPVGRGSGGERDRRMSTVQIMYTHDLNAKMIPVETVPGLGGGDEGEQWRG